MKRHYALLLLISAVTSASAASTSYSVDPDHTHPSFEPVLTPPFSMR
jgi:hypothetical protein